MVFINFKVLSSTIHTLFGCFHFTKHSGKTFIEMFHNAFNEFVFMSSMMSKRNPFNTDFNFDNKNHMKPDLESMEARTELLSHINSLFVTTNSLYKFFYKLPILLFSIYIVSKVSTFFYFCIHTMF